MKTFFIEAKASIDKVNFETKTLPKKIGIVTTIQYLQDMKKVSDFLWKKDIKAVVAGQVLGCDASAAAKIKDDVDAFLYVGTGEFHPIGVALKTNKQVFKLHPESMVVTKVNEEDIDRIMKKKRAMLLKFHSSDTIGVLMTTKKGQKTVQCGLEELEKTEKKFKDKRFYHFIADTLNFPELENFNFIQCWVNTMCPRMMEDINVLNIEDLNNIHEIR